MMLAPDTQTVGDQWGDAWSVAESRPTDYGHDVLLGWPHPLPSGPRGRPKTIMTGALAATLEDYRTNPGDLRLPVGATTIKRLRALLGHNRYLDRRQWWEDRAVDLADLTLDEFARRHGVTAGAASRAATALWGPALRPAGWWRAPEVAMLLLGDLPAAEIAAQQHRRRIGAALARRYPPNAKRAPGRGRGLLIHSTSNG